jgi:hypothetical protein
MISAITGLHGAGKTWFMVNKFGYPHWLAGGNILAFNELLFSPNNERIERFYQLSDLYGAKESMILFPELQKLLNADSWRSLPATFRDLLSEHRHSQLNIVGDTQNLMLIDINLRRHISEVYHCRTILRLPWDETKLPIIHWIRVQRKIQRFDNSGTQVLFKPVGNEANYFISKLWTKTLYNTYEKLKTEKFSIWTEYKKKRWTVRMVNRELLQSGRVRKK